MFDLTLKYVTYRYIKMLDLTAVLTAGYRKQGRRCVLCTDRTTDGQATGQEISL